MAEPADMWRLDIQGTPLDDPESAREELRCRAWLAIGNGLQCGRDVRHHCVKARDENGAIVFEGTLAKAVESNVEALVPPMVWYEAFAVGSSRRIRNEASVKRHALKNSVALLSMSIASAKREFQVSVQLIEAAQHLGCRKL